jgi:hypothetical protein
MKTIRQLTRHALILHLGHTTYKLFAPQNRVYRSSELEGNKRALQAGFWAGHVLRIEPHFLSLSMAKGEPIAPGSTHKIDAFISDKLMQTFYYPRQRMSEAFDFAKLHKLETRGLMPGLLSKCKKILEDTFLPITSSHGDFHAGNMLCIGERLVLIDWDMFSPRGSFITDYIHCLNYRSAQLQQESWSLAILRQSAYLDELAQLFELTARQLRLAYCISRMAGELQHHRSIQDLQPKRIQKYNRVLCACLDKAL